MKKLQAFSMVELSIVILVIGIVIAGIASGSILLAKVRLSNAKTLTQSSPVSAIENLVGWWEPTLDESFEAQEAEHGNTISVWHDINPQTANKKDATQTSSTSQRPTYAIDSNLDLPMLSFYNDYLSLPDGTVPYGNSPYTVFLVSKVSQSCTCGVLGSGAYSSGGTNKTNAFRYASTYFRHYWWGNDMDVYGSGELSNYNVLRIFTITYDNTSGVGRKFYINGTLSGTKTSTSRNSTASSNTIGVTKGSEYLRGSIAEIIIFDRDLDDDERESIESYLGQKWDIDVVS